jgi:probable F420-dependent oxidoreductase
MIWHPPIAKHGAQIPDPSEQLQARLTITICIRYHLLSPAINGWTERTSFVALDIQFGIQIGFTSAEKLREQALAAEEAGLYGLFLADHPGTSASPHVALAAAAAVTKRIRLGAYVLNSGIRHPIDVANELSTLDVLSNGRAIFGVGAGHTPHEWTARGLDQPSPGQRVTDLESFVQTTSALMTGAVVSFDCPSFRIDSGQIVKPLAIQKPMPILIGGNGQRVLTIAGRVADIVSISGLGRTKTDGHTHETNWGPNAVSASIAAVESGASARKRGPKREAIVQGVKITSRREEFLEGVAEIASIPISDLRDTPFFLAGTEEEIVEQLRRNAERWNITSYVALEDSLSDVIRLAICLR